MISLAIRESYWDICTARIHRLLNRFSLQPVNNHLLDLVELVLILSYFLLLRVRCQSHPTCTKDGTAVEP